MTSTNADFVDQVMRHFTAGEAETASKNIRAYFDPKLPFTGSQFELLADTDHPNEITANDIVAVSTLSVTIPPKVAVWLLGENRRRR